MATSAVSWEERMREAQRLGHEDALSGRKPGPAVFAADRAWVANYYAGATGGNFDFAPLPWTAELAFALASALGTELADGMRPRYPLARWAEASAIKMSLGARRRRARLLGLGPNAELPLLRANPNMVPTAIGLLAIVSLIAPRLGARRSLVSFSLMIAISATSHYAWRRAGLPTKPPNRRRASAPE